MYVSAFRMPLPLIPIPHIPLLLLSCLPVSVLINAVVLIVFPRMQASNVVVILSLVSRFLHELI